VKQLSSSITSLWLGSVIKYFYYIIYKIKVKPPVKWEFGGNHGGTIKGGGKDGGKRNMP